MSAICAADGKTRRDLLLAGSLAVLAVVAACSGYAVLHSSGLPARDYPAARLAGTVFGGDAIPPGQGIAQTMGRVASFGGTTVAVGSQAGGDIPRAQFFVSHDNGSTWDVAAVVAPGGGAPSPGHAAQLVARGPHGWLAVGPDAIWTSATGQSWTLASSAGIVPSDAGDQLSVLTATGSGFLAAGQNPAEGTAVIWTSPDGRHWQRMTAAQLRLPAGGNTVADLTSAAVSGGAILLAGHVIPPAGGRVAATWLSTDDGQTWKWAPVPVSHGATGALAGIAASGAGFVAIRPGRSSPGSSAAAQANGVVYASADGMSWRYTATLTAPHGVQLGMVQAGAGGFVALGRGPAGALGAYVSPNGLTWGPVIPFGPAPPSVTGATVTAGGTVVVTGSTGAPGRRQPYLALAPVGQVAQTVDVAAIPGGSISQLSANAVAVSGNQRVAVGEAGGSPAIWTATGLLLVPRHGCPDARPRRDLARPRRDPARPRRRLRGHGTIQGRPRDPGRLRRRLPGHAPVPPFLRPGRRRAQAHQRGARPRGLAGHRRGRFRHGAASHPADLRRRDDLERDRPGRGRVRRSPRGRRPGGRGPGRLRGRRRRHHQRGNVPRRLVVPRPAHLDPRGRLRFRRRRR